MKTIKPLITILIFTLCLQGYAQNDKNLIEAIEKNKLSKFKKQVDNLEDINLELENGYTLLSYSVKYIRNEFVGYLIEKGVDIEKVNRGKSPLMSSCKGEGRLEITKQLIEAGADVNQNYRGKTAVSYAFKYGNKKALKILDEKGAVNFSSVDGPYLLHNTNTNYYELIRIDTSHQLNIDISTEKPDFIILDFPSKPNVKVDLTTITDENTCIFPKPDKIFAISDIEGNYNKFHKTLAGNNIIDSDLNWNFGDGHLVLVGDFVDRGKNVAAVLWLIYKLEQEAIKAGGKVHFILGNHEIMNMQGHSYYADSKYHILAYRTQKEVSDFYGLNAELGKWLRSKNVIEKIGEHLFVHGGISDSLLKAEIPISDINTIARNNLDTPKSNNLSDLIFNSYGVLWYRGLVFDGKKQSKATETAVDGFLNFYSAKDITIGHCIVDDISTDYNGKVIRIDIDHDETSSAGILIENDKIFKMTTNGEKTLLN